MIEERGESIADGHAVAEDRMTELHFCVMTAFAAMRECIDMSTLCRDTSLDTSDVASLRFVRKEPPLCSCPFHAPGNRLSRRRLHLISCTQCMHEGQRHHISGSRRLAESELDRSRWSGKCGRTVGWAACHAVGEDDDWPEEAQPIYLSLHPKSHAPLPPSRNRYHRRDFVREEDVFLVDVI